MRSRKTLLFVLIGAAAVCLALATSWPVFAQTARLRAQLETSSRIGVTSRDVTRADVSGHKLPGEFGAYVDQVESGGPADKAGIHSGDVIVEFDGIRVRSTAELQRLVRETPAGRTVKVGVVRDGKHLDLSVTTQPGAMSMFPEFREGPLQPSFRYRVFPDLPSYRLRPPTSGEPFVYPRPNTPRLGIGLQELTPQLAEYFRTKEGVLVSSVTDGSPASRAGVKAGDIVTSIDGRAVTHVEDVSGVVRDKKPGQEVTLGIVRDGKPRTIRITL